ncbi:uncharacterized protein LOC143301166 [Babylonia areolata]|uniref:uncharacterized protein LOC143301166 n=1 Tax=Babylonia areolata TaxID=304850 RepID=UPI003FCF877F
MANPGTRTTANKPEVYEIKMNDILVTKDPVYSHPAIQNGAYVGRQPNTYLPLAILLTIVNPVLGPIALVFSYLSNRAFKRGDLPYADKWSRYTFLSCMIIIVASLIIYIAIGFSLSKLDSHGGHSY